MKSRKLVSLIAVVAGVAAMAWGPSVASADTYAPGANAQNFQTGPGGWTATVQNDGLCIPPLLCPSVSGNFNATGGIDGDGYISADLVGLLTTTAATSNLLWESPAFVYNGNGGQAPATASFDLARLPNINALLNLDVLNNTTIRADLVDQSNGSVINLLPAIENPENDGVWAAVPTQSVNPSRLALGRTYKIRITTTYHTVLAVIPNGSVGYDNVALSTAGVADGSGGNNNTNNNSNNGGTTINNSSELQALILTSGMPSVGVLKGNTMRIRVKCPHSAIPNRCRYKVQGLAKGRKSPAATSRGKARVKFGGAKLVRVKVKPKFLARYQKASKVTVRAKVRIGNVTTVAYKKVRLVHR